MTRWQIISAVICAVASEQACFSAPAAALPTSIFQNAGPPSYLPLPGSSVTVTNTCASGKEVSYPDAFPDITSRFSLARLQANGGVSYGPVGATAERDQYKASVDYANTDVIPVTVWIKESGGDSPSYDVRRNVPPADNYVEVVVPVLIGVGFRVSADFVITKAKAEVTGLGIIGVNASASKLQGTLMVEALGVSGKAISAAIPLPSKLDQSTVESAILAIGAGRASAYDAGGQTSVQPRVVGMLSPGTNPKLVALIQAEIIRGGVTWTRPCKP